MGRVSIKSAISRYIKGMRKIEINVNNVSVSPNQLLQGKCAIVTGAGSGIGLAVAKTYIESGAVVIGLGRNKNKLDEAQKNWEKTLFRILATYLMLIIYLNTLKK